MKIKYNWEFERYVTEDGKVLRYDSKQDKLVLCKQTTNRDGYKQICVSKPKIVKIWVHRLVYETFNGVIPKGMVIDHQNTIRDDNRLENLRCVTQKENNNNPLTLKHHLESVIGQVRSELGIKFKEHFGITRYENKKLYARECSWYHKHNKTCSWE